MGQDSNPDSGGSLKPSSDFGAGNFFLSSATEIVTASAAGTAPGVLRDWAASASDASSSDSEPAPANKTSSNVTLVVAATDCFGATAASSSASESSESWVLTSRSLSSARAGLRCAGF